MDEKDGRDNGEQPKIEMIMEEGFNPPLFASTASPNFPSTIG
jgi:hypothetical protein